MTVKISPLEARIIGSMLEKSITTPDYYPLTLNALATACNQKSNRDPVLELDERDIVRGLDSLRDQQLVYQLSSAGSRVPKYAHCLERHFAFTDQQLAVLTMLLLRGFQTAGELRTRSQRLYDFASVDAVEATLSELMQRDDGPFVMQLPRLPGRREHRYAHLFCGEPELESVAGASVPPESATLAVRAEQQRLSELEEHVHKLQAQLDRLQAEFNAFKAELQ